MTWVKLDDGFVRHPRMVAAGLHGRALFIAGLCYCGAHLTDGRIPKAALPMLAAEAGVRVSVAAKLVEVGSWVDHGDVLEVHDFLVYNPSRAKVLGDREAGAERQRKSRESRPLSRVTDAVTSRDPSRSDVPTEQEQSMPSDGQQTKRGTRLPDDFDVDDTLRRWAFENQIAVDLDAETEQWRDYHRAKGDTAKDWRASWRTWMRNAKKFTRTPVRRSGPDRSGVEAFVARTQAGR